MAVAVDQTGSATAFDTTGPSTDFTVVGAGGANYLVAFAAWTHNAVARTISGVTYNGVAMTELAQITSTGGPHPGASLFGLANPASGLHALATTIGLNTDDVVHGFVSLSGAAGTQTGTNGEQTGASTSPAVTVTGVADGLVIGVAGINHAAASVSTAETELVENTSSGNQDTTGSLVSNAGTGSVQLDWTIAASRDWAAVAFPIEAGAGGGSSFTALMNATPFFIFQ